MNLRLTFLLAFVALMLGLLASFWERDEDAARDRYEQARRSFRFDPTRVQRLIIESGDLSLECRRSQDRWRLVRPISARAESVAVERLLGGLQELSRGDIILPPRRSPEPYAPYGLDRPRAGITLIENGLTNRILIGRRTPLGDGVYVRQADQPAVARLHADLMDLLPASPDALRDRTLLAGDPAAMDRLDIRTPAGYIQLARDADGAWRLFQPFTARADSATVMALIEKLLAGRIAHFVQDGVGDLAPYGLDSQGAITVVLNTGTGNGTQMLSLGDALPNAPTLVYARLQAEDSIYAVPAELREALNIRPDDLRDRRLPALPLSSVARLRMEENESVLEFERDADGRWIMTMPMQAPADDEAVNSLLRAWGDVRLSAFDGPSSSPDAALPRLLWIEMRNAEAPPLQIRLGPHPEKPDQILLETDGQAAWAAASPSGLLDAPLDPLLYRSRDMLTIPSGDVAEIHLTTSAQSLRLARDPATGQWPADAPWADRLLARLSPLRAQSLMARGSRPGMGFQTPFLSLEIRLRGQTGLGVTLQVGAETAPGGPRWAAVRGRDLVFTLSPETLADLLPPGPEALK